jgi:hypothetical protein
MTKRTLLISILGGAALAAASAAWPGCGGDNSPSTTPITTGSSGGATGSGAGGATVASGAGGATASGAGGATVASGAGGATTAGAGGATGSSTFGQPACGNTVAGMAIGKSVTCTAADTQLCYKSCGPEKAGVKSETCSGGTYAEMTGCSFDPSKDYSCYKVPATVSAQDPRCPTTAIMVSAGGCTVPDCVVCGLSAGYVDSGGSAKTGYCVCQANGNWSCASNTAWPCPGNSGC